MLRSTPLDFPVAKAGGSGVPAVLRGLKKFVIHIQEKATSDRIFLRRNAKGEANMKSTLSTGLSATRSLVVDTERTIDFLGEALRVYATPALVRDFEYACREFLLDHLDAGEDSVGTGISVSHEGATLRGMNVQITVTVAKIEGRLVTFTLHARDDVEQISQGSHSRFVVEVEKLRSRVAAKANKVGKPSASN